MTRSPDYKTHRDGSIDYGFYLRRSHEIRSLGAHRVFRRMFGAVTALFRKPSATPPVVHRAAPMRAGRPAIRRAAPAGRPADRASRV